MTTKRTAAKAKLTVKKAELQNLTQSEIDRVRDCALRCREVADRAFDAIDDYFGGYYVGYNGDQKLVSSQDELLFAIKEIESVWTPIARDFFHLHRPSPDEKFGGSLTAIEMSWRYCMFWKKNVERILSFDFEEMAIARRDCIAISPRHLRMSTDASIQAEWVAATKQLESDRLVKAGWIPLSPKELERRYGVSHDVMVEMLKKQEIPNTKRTDRMYWVDPTTLPETPK